MFISWPTRYRNNGRITEEHENLRHATFSSGLPGSCPLGLPWHTHITELNFKILVTNDTYGHFRNIEFYTTWAVFGWFPLPKLIIEYQFAVLPWQLNKAFTVKMPLKFLCEQLLNEAYWRSVIMPNKINTGHRGHWIYHTIGHIQCLSFDWHLVTHKVWWDAHDNSYAQKQHAFSFFS